MGRIAARVSVLPVADLIPTAVARDRPVTGRRMCVVATMTQGARPRRIAQMGHVSLGVV